MSNLCLAVTNTSWVNYSAFAICIFLGWGHGLPSNVLPVSLVKQTRAATPSELGKKMAAGETVNKITFISPAFLLLREFGDSNEQM